jgi:hypothetical protein
MKSLLIILLFLPLLSKEASGQVLESLIADPLIEFPGDSVSECARLYAKVDALAGSGKYQQMYDSAKHIIDLCPTYQDVWRDFGVASSGCQYMSSDKHRWPPYRDWLKKVLYYNLDSAYYCSDVKGMLTSMQYFEGRGLDQNGYLAILKFLIDSSKCLTFMANVWEDWNSVRGEQKYIWSDSVVDPKATPLDTTLPTLEDLDLEILRGPQYAAVKNAFTPSTSKKILSLSASENPFTDETTLRFALSDKEYIKVELYDLLGKVVYSDGGLFTEGDGSLRIEGKGIPRGQLYARLSTMGGEVLTIALVKQ